MATVSIVCETGTNSYFTLGKWACFNCLSTLSPEEVMASIQAPSTYIPSKICSPGKGEEEMDIVHVALSNDEIIPEPPTEILTTGTVKKHTEKLNQT